MATRNRAVKKNKNKKKPDGPRSRKSSAQKRGERIDRTATAQALVKAAEALTRASEALLKAINTHFGEKGPTRNIAFAATAEALKGNCLDLSTAGQIVENAVNSSDFDIDKTLEQMGLISPPQRQVFRQDVLNSVRNLGCQINDTSVPNAADDTARKVRDTIVDEAFQ